MRLWRIVVKKKIMLIYPPGRKFQRGEDRCQSNVEKSVSTSPRACNDLGYAAAVLLQDGNYEVFLKDYQTEELDVEQVTADFKSFQPDAVFVSTTNGTIFDDLDIVRTLKKERSDTCFILKGALFFNPPERILSDLDLSDIEYLIGGEFEFVLAGLLNIHFGFSADDIKQLPGIIYKQDGQWHYNDFKSWCSDLDSLPFPARQLMNNKLYMRPDTGEPIATISTSRGCPASCIYCLTPVISGDKVRFRSPQNILDELKECYNKFGIRNFFFKSDTFTIKKSWTIELCNMIMESELNGKIAWVANSRTNPIDAETLAAMKQAGCWLVAFGFESGSENTLQKIKKGTTVEQNLKAAKFAHQVGLKIFGFFVIGLPWEDRADIEVTTKHIFKLNPDFIEVHMATPYYGTELFAQAQEMDLIKYDEIFGKDFYDVPPSGTTTLSPLELSKIRNRILLRFHLRPSYLFHRLMDVVTSPKTFFSYSKFGLKMLKNALLSSGE